MAINQIIRYMLFIYIAGNFMTGKSYSQNKELDDKVMEFLKSKEGTWDDLNVPSSDGKLLFDIIVDHKYKNALEIGTSTGHSSIWIAWALSKTGGKLITIEIDDRRYNEALSNFEKAGLLKYIDARLGDAHKLIPALKGPFDFIFSDADKDWYINYFKAVDPKLIKGGCFTSHNVNKYQGRDYYNYIKALPNYETTVDESGAGMAISYKTFE